MAGDRATRECAGHRATGSGKTLSAFLFAIDSLLSRSAADHARKGVRVLYISPLKALGVDVAKNLDVPLAGIREQIDALGSHAPQVTVATRSGDHDPKERRAIMSHPAGHVLVTDPGVAVSHAHFESARTCLKRWIP